MLLQLLVQVILLINTGKQQMVFHGPEQAKNMFYSINNEINDEIFMEFHGILYNYKKLALSSIIINLYPKKVMSCRRLWTEHEDKVLRILFEQRKTQKWTEVAKIMEKQFNIPLRSGKQCRERYFNHLDDNIKRQKWSQQQQNQLVISNNLIGNRWAQISRNIPGRSQNCVKNKFFSILRKGLRFINGVIKCTLKRYKQIEISVIYKIVQYCEAHYNKRVMSRQVQDIFDIKKQIVTFGLDQFNQEEEVERVKSVIEKIKGFLKKINSKEWARQKEEDHIQEERRYKGLDNVILKEEMSDEMRDRIRDVHQQKEEKQQLKPTSSYINFPIVQPQRQAQKKNESKQSFKSFEMSEMRPFDLVISDLKSFQMPEFDRPASPKVMVFESPYFDQLRLSGSVNSWNQFYPH